MNPMTNMNSLNNMMQGMQDMNLNDMNNMNMNRINSLNMNPMNRRQMPNGMRGNQMSGGKPFPFSNLPFTPRRQTEKNAEEEKVVVKRSTGVEQASNWMQPGFNNEPKASSADKAKPS